MIRFNQVQNQLILEYEPDLGSPTWVLRRLKNNQEVTISRGFSFVPRDLISGPSSEWVEKQEEPIFRFRFAVHEDGYYRIVGRKLGIPNDVLIVDQGIKLERKLFVAERNIRIFRRIAKVKQDDTDISIGGDQDGNIPVEVFQELLDKFPSSGELDRYANARVETVIGEFFDGMKSARENYENYLSRRKSSVSNKPLEQENLLQAEIDKFMYVRDTISSWLQKADSYSERDWQKLIAKVILLIFPKYIAVLENVKIDDFYSSPGETKKKEIDFCLVDADGNIDVIEIKKPFDNAILRKGLYRDNNIPARELSGSIMQAEKYLFHLSKWGVAGERKLLEKYARQLPHGMSIRITNPKAMIILGRDNLVSGQGQKTLQVSQKLDLQVIKRKYANMMDILTYDDLLCRLENVIASLSQRMKTQEPGQSASEEYA